MPRVLCGGNLVVDVNARPAESLPPFGVVNFVETIALIAGGNGGNTSCALAMLGVAVSLVARVGDDPLGVFLLGHLRKHGVDISQVGVDKELPTSTTSAIINSRGERSGLHAFGANANLCESDFDFQGLTGSAPAIFHLCATFLLPRLDGAPAARLLANARRLGCPTSMDVSWDGKGRWLSLIEPCLPFIDYFLPNLDEARAISGRSEVGEMAEFFLSRGVRTAVIKLGPGGCYVRSGSQHCSAPAFETEVVDTTGAGDTFIAGFLAGILSGWDLPRCARLGNAAAALRIGPAGLVSREQALAMLAVPRA